MDSPSAVYSWLYLFREAYHFIESGRINIAKDGIGNTLQAFPFLMPLNGYIYEASGVIGGFDNEGNIWEATMTEKESGDIYSSRLVFTNNYITTENNVINRNGWAVRCEINRTDTTQRDKFISSPYNFPYSGYYHYGGGVYYQSSYGYWWSRSSYTTADRAYTFYLYTSGYVAPQYGDNVGYGFAVRCVGE